MIEKVNNRTTETGYQPSREAGGAISAAVGGAVESGAVAAEDLVEEAARCIGHYPFSAVVLAFGGGVLTGWLIACNLRTRLSAGSGERGQRTSEVTAYKRAIAVWENEGGAALA